MRIRLTVLLIVASFGCVALSLTRGQEQPRTPATPPAAPPTVVPAAYKEVAPAAAPALSETTAGAPTRDLSKLTDLQKQLLPPAQRGAEWLFRMNGLKGRFQYGYLPALDKPLEGDHFLHQAAAAFALARAARLTGEKRYAARATQAVLALLDETTADAKDPQLRHTALPSMVLNRLGTAGMLVLAINELPTPPADLLERSEQLCNFIRRQARPDGSLCTSDPGEDGKTPPETADAVNQYPGPALYALMLSQRHLPAAWKTDVVRKAVAYYHPWWREHKNMAFVPWQTAAYAEAYLLTKEPAFARCVVELNDWLSNLQYETPRQQSWFGGFMTWTERGAAETVPTIAAAEYAGSLVHAGRVAREAGDANRFDRYTAAAERGLHFVSTLQYTLANTKHFDPTYRDVFLSGGFHPSPQDGTLRLDDTAHAVAALLLYLEYGTR